MLDEEAALRAAERALERWYGIEIPDYQQKVLRGVVERLGGAQGVSGGLERLLDREASAWDEVIDAITIPETFFFRHFGHFGLLRELAIERRKRGLPFRVLSAGCSSGEEVWSAAAVVADVAAGAPWPARVTGWDVNAGRVLGAAAGRYRDWSARAGFHGYDRYFMREGEVWRASPSLEPWVSFQVVNLIGPFPPVSDGFDVILFRNVAIYWDPATASAVGERLAQLLVEDGLLLVGPSDPVTLDPARFEHTIANGVRSIRRATATRPERSARRPSPPATPERPVAQATSPRSAPLDHRRSARPLVRAGAGRLVPTSAARRPPRSEPREAAVAAPPIESTLASVKALADEGQYRDALLMLRAGSLGDAERFKLEGILLLNLESPSEAVDCLRRCVYLEPERAEYRRWLAVAYETAGLHREAAREERNAREVREQ
jgi:chemotaxis methyl-accepting protein methylase